MTTNTFLRDLGLNEKEIEIYAYLAKNGTRKALSIATSLRMHKMEVYRSLDAMQKKGIVTLTFETPKRFAAIPIEKLVNIRILSLKEKLFNIDKSTERILNYSGFSFPTQDQLSTFSIIQGKENIEGLVSEVLNKATKEICVVTRGEYLGKLIMATTNEYSRRANPKFSSRYIIQVSTKDSRESTAPFLKTLSTTRCQLHKTAANNEKLFGLAIADDKEAVLFVEESAMTVLWTDNASITYVFKGFFEKLWTDTVEILPSVQQSGLKQY
jgi:sugar-specific transcriptional regulator TrmB